MRSIYFILLGVICIVTSQAQDIHFSQFYMSPLNLNPAFTGVMNNTQRFTGNYRNQLASVLKSNAFKTYSFSYDQKIAVGRHDYFGIGGTLWGDVAGEADFKTIQGKISGSYSRRVAGDRTTAHYLVAGADIGISQRSLDFMKLRFGTQHDGEGRFDEDIASGEYFTRDNFTFLDISAGLLWFSVLDKNSNFYGGAAFRHLNRPNVSFTHDSIVPVYSLYTFHAGGEWGFAQDVSLVPGFVAFKQGPSLLINFGSAIRFALAQDRNTSNTFQVGAWMRLVNNYIFVDAEGNGKLTRLGPDAVILFTKIEFQNIGLGFSYDWNISDLRVASNGNGSIEFSIVYTIDAFGSRGVYCPQF